MEKNSLNILVGVSGGIAAYKALEVVSALRKDGHNVQVAMSGAAQKFVQPLSFEAVSGKAVLTEQFPEGQAASLEEIYPHLYPATEADVFILVPATANKISQLAQGLGQDIISTSVLSLPPHCTRIFCPAMNVEMWEQEIIQEHSTILEDKGWTRIGPESGHLACGMVGSGRLSQAETIVQYTRQLLELKSQLTGKTVMILSGPTREHIDPVRYIGNPSSGKMGKALAEAALHAGAAVEFITGPVDSEYLPVGAKLNIHKVVSAKDMLDKTLSLHEKADVMIFAAAVADYTPAQSHAEKLPKSENGISLELVNTTDIAALIGKKKAGHQVSIGFALQTVDGEQRAIEKYQKKNLDAIILNYTEAMGSDSAEYKFIKDQNVDAWGRMSKTDCAAKIITEAAVLLKQEINV